MRRHTSFYCGFALATLIVSAAASAPCGDSPYICYSNILLPSYGTELITSSGLYNSFTTGYQSNQGILEVDFLLEGMGGGQIAVLSDNPDNTPGDVLYSETFRAQPPLDAPPDSLYTFEFYPTMGMDVWPLVANTRYWIMLSSSGDSLSWSYSPEPGDGTEGEFWSDGSGVFANDAGRGPFQMNLGNGHGLIPETSTWVMMLAGFIGLSFIGYRRRDKGAVVRRVG